MEHLKSFKVFESMTRRLFDDRVEYYNNKGDLCRIDAFEPNLNLFKDLPLEDIEELSADLCDKYDGEVKKWKNFYVIYFKDKLDKNDSELKSFEVRLKDFTIRVNNKFILVY